MTNWVVLTECDNHSQLLKHLLKDVVRQMAVWRLRGDSAAVTTMQYRMSLVARPSTSVMLKAINTSMRFLGGIGEAGFPYCEYHEVFVPPKSLSPGPYKYRLIRRNYENPRGYLRQP